jgi:hypothetical protein
VKASILAIFSLFPLFVTPASAQYTHGYGFIGSTLSGKGVAGAFRYGIGGEGSMAPHLTLGGEIGGMQKGTSGVVVSGNAAFHLPISSYGDRVDPFLTAGVSVAHLGGTGAFVNIGGGLNYWWRRNFAMRFEFRGYAGGGDLNGFSELRFGLAFR